MEDTRESNLSLGLAVTGLGLICIIFMMSLIDYLKSQEAPEIVDILELEIIEVEYEPSAFVGSDVYIMHYLDVFGAKRRVNVRASRLEKYQESETLIECPFVLKRVEYDNGKLDYEIVGVDI